MDRHQSDKDSPMITRYQRRPPVLAIVAGLMLLLTSGCMSYRTGGLPVVGFDRKIFPDKPTLKAFFEVRFFSQTVIETTPRENVAMSQQMRKVIAGGLNDCAVFKSYTFSAYDATNADLLIVLTIQQKESGWLPMAALSGATLCAIPCTWSETYDLTAEVLDNKKQQKAHYELRDSMRNWIQILLLPLSPWKSPDKVQKQLIENMVRAILTRMNNDNLLRNTKQ